MTSPVQWRRNQGIKYLNRLINAAFASISGNANWFFVSYIRFFYVKSRSVDNGIQVLSYKINDRLPKRNYDNATVEAMLKRAPLYR